MKVKNGNGGEKIKTLFKSLHLTEVNFIYFTYYYFILMDGEF